MDNSKHRFAFFASLDAVKKANQVIFLMQDDALVKRIASVLRMKKGDQVTLFDYHCSARVTLEGVSKKSVTFSVQSIHETEHATPEITCLLPLLKRDALAIAITRLSVLGVRKIQLVISEKSRYSLTQKEFLRLQKMIIAAAEQSKSFAMPELIAPQKLEDCINDQIENAFLFDQYGASCREIITQKFTGSIIVAFGPEGDFTDQEKKLFTDNGYRSLLLTDSVLRTIDAVILGIGLFKLS